MPKPNRFDKISLERWKETQTALTEARKLGEVEDVDSFVLRFLFPDAEPDDLSRNELSEALTTHYILHALVSRQHEWFNEPIYIEEVKARLETATAEELLKMWHSTSQYETKGGDYLSIGLYILKDVLKHPLPDNLFSEEKLEGETTKLLRTLARQCTFFNALYYRNADRFANAYFSKFNIRLKLGENMSSRPHAVSSSTTPSSV